MSFVLHPVTLHFYLYKKLDLVLEQDRKKGSLEFWLMLHLGLNVNLTKEENVKRYFNQDAILWCEQVLG